MAITERQSISAIEKLFVSEADFRTWFNHRAVYLLPDGTRVVALWRNFGDRPLWWFVAERSTTPGRWGHLKIAVVSTGSVYRYVPQPDAQNPEVFVPCISDLTVADIRPV
jgi:hypothetical protein